MTRPGASPCPTTAAGRTSAARWGWVPGPARSRAYYAPALVAFVGGSNFQLTISSGNVGGVAWFPLGPREVYRPSYPVSRGYFENVNRSNTVINNTVINNYYNNTNVTNIVYANQQVSGRDRRGAGDGVRAVAAGVPVGRPRHAGHGGERAGHEPCASIAPTERSVRGAADARAASRRRAPSSAPPSPAPRLPRRVPDSRRSSSQLAAQPGKPLDDAARQALKPARAAPAPAVTVVEQARKAPPTRPGRRSRRCQAAPKPRSRHREARRSSAPSPKPRERPSLAPSPEQPAQGEPRAQAAPGSTAPHAKAEPRAKPEQPAQGRARDQAREQPAKADATRPAAQARQPRKRRRTRRRPTKKRKATKRKKKEREDGERGKPQD